MKGAFLLLGLFGSLVAAAAPGPGGWSFEEIRRIPAPEARQGVAADGTHLFAINNHALGQYRQDTGERVRGWECPEGDPLIHLNAGIVHAGRLYCAHSNYPGVPHVSSVEIWDAATLVHVGTHSFGRTDGSLTWLDRHGGRWVACFVHYGKKGGEPGKGPEWTRLVEFDDAWRPTGRGWVFPAALVAHLGGRGYSVSGGAFGPDGRLFATGHDEPELYVLEFPPAGGELRWVATVPVPIEGQAFGWSPDGDGIIWFVARKSREIVAGRLSRPATAR